MLTPGALGSHSGPARGRTQLGRTKTYELLARGFIPSVRIGSKIIRIRREDVDAWLTQQAEA
jgi:excisionase family DNA binding protein